MELYISANNINNQRELFYLKSLCCLIVLDLTFNPVATMESYRSFAVFHLPFLKALDGRPIVSMEKQRECVAAYGQPKLGYVL